jgi:hypothetical protein
VGAVSDRECGGTADNFAVRDRSHKRHPVAQRPSDAPAFWKGSSEGVSSFEEGSDRSFPVNQRISVGFANAVAVTNSRRELVNRSYDPFRLAQPFS